MAHGTSLTSLVIVILAAFLTPIFLHRMKLNLIPVVVAEIVIGLILGKSGFNVVHEDTWLETLSTLGFIFLMFLSGLEIDFQAFSKEKNKKNNGPNPLFLSIIIFIGIFSVSYGLSYLFMIAGFIDNAFLMTIIISTISLSIVVPTLKEESLMKTKIGQIILLVAVIADLATMILLAIFVSFYEGGGNTWLLLLLFGAVILLYFAGKKFKDGKLIEKLSRGTVQIGTRAVFALIIFFVALSERVGAENILGAFLAGVLVSLLAPSKELIQRLDSFGYGFFIPIFFVMIGVEIDLWSLLGDPKMVLLIPLLLLALFLSKFIPILLLKKWFDFKTVFSSSLLLTSTLSLVIAASTIGERLGIIETELSGTLILVAVISCIITPILFKKYMTKQEIEDSPIRVAMIGANNTSLSVYKDLKSSNLSPTLFHRKQEKESIKTSESIFNITELDDYEDESLEKNGIFSYDVVVLSTSDQELNGKLALKMKERGIERVIARIESPDLQRFLREKGVEIYSNLLSQHVLLRIAIESPSMVDLLTNKESSLYEISIQNPKYHGMKIRKFPFTGDVLFVRIFRGDDLIVPHGETELRLDDRLIVSGTKKYADELKMELERKE
ncbi:monovalent cation:proton antiporter family protein [Fervidibacillus halotolerans]|uniref:Monovalent cation:proton antiporter family protein n=1 Tax=Fervidibacillus halotolerans TaxID=2980027 RepID=A0A9E8M087_9BACI|nr:monovalent cation:proton antiporter family protein [Fervidibacillus halotolerans]WAA13078.1 monovalent cation:proton antiporter family protein [Fervidibacillus halotolerans]